MYKIFPVRCEHIFHVMRHKWIDVSKLTPKGRSLSCLLTRQRLERKTPGGKQPGKFDRASADVQVEQDQRVQMIREEQERKLRTTPTAGNLLQSAGLAAVPEMDPTAVVLTPPHHDLSPELAAVPEMDPTLVVLTPPPHVLSPVSSTPPAVRPRAKRKIALNFIDEDITPMESLKKRKVTGDNRGICQTCDKTFASSYTLN